MSNGEDEKATMTKGESNNSLFGEDIDSREGTPSPPNDDAQDPTADIPGPPPMEDIPAVSSGESGKPPKAPRAPSLLMPRPSPVSRNASAEHSRKQSLDEVSAMSGLTDPDAGEDIGISFRGNTSVSWMKDVAAQDANIGMPILGDTVDTATPLPPMSPPTVASTPPVKMRAKRNWGKIKAALALKEEGMSTKAVNPLETEAEAAILRILDKTRRKNATKAENILPHVSDKAADMFRQDAILEQSNASGYYNKRGSQDDQSVRSGNTRASSSIAKGHNRTKTLDDKLFDLAAQLNNLQNHDTGDSGRARTYTADSNGGRGRLFSEDKGLTVMTEYKGDSGDVLVQNAAALFRRPITKREGSTDASQGSVSSPPQQQQHDSSPASTGERRFSSIHSKRSEKSRNMSDDIILEGAESKGSEFDVETGVECGVDAEGGNGLGGGNRRRLKLGRAGKLVKATNDEMKEDFDTFRRFLEPRKGTIKYSLLFLVGCVIIPVIAVAAILYHVADNPGLGREGASTR